MEVAFGYAAGAIEQLETVSSLEVSSSVQKLNGFANFYRLRIKDYRIGFILEVVSPAKTTYRQ